MQLQAVPVIAIAKAAYAAFKMFEASRKTMGDQTDWDMFAPVGTMENAYIDVKLLPPKPVVSVPPTNTPQPGTTTSVPPGTVTQNTGNQTSAPLDTLESANSGNAGLLLLAGLGALLLFRKRR